MTASFLIYFVQNIILDVRESDGNMLTTEYAGD